MTHKRPTLYSLNDRMERLETRLHEQETLDGFYETKKPSVWGWFRLFVLFAVCFLLGIFWTKLEFSFNTIFSDHLSSHQVQTPVSPKIAPVTPLVIQVKENTDFLLTPPYCLVDRNVGEVWTITLQDQRGKTLFERQEVFPKGTDLCENRLEIVPLVNDGSPSYVLRQTIKAQRSNMWGIDTELPPVFIHIEKK